MKPTENVKIAKRKFLLEDLRFIQQLKNVWIANKFLFNFFLILAILIVDQFIKYLVLNNKNFSFLEVFCNPGFSLGLSLNFFWFWFFWFMALVFLILLIKKFKNLFLILVLAGALSNLIDRLLYGCVVDYVSILNFPVFNLADFLISFGFVGFLIFYQKKS